MEPGETTASSPATRMTAESVERRVRRLAQARRRATALLAVVAAVFAVVTGFGAHGTLLGFVQAGAEAAMVGGVADWFAVTALFRHPLGIPIPHTALIVERKDQFAATMGAFVSENFLSPDVLAERIRAAGPARRLAAWLANPQSAASIAGHAADVVVTLAGTLQDEDVQSALTAEVTRVLQGVEVAPLAGRVVGIVIAGGHQAAAFDTLVSTADRYLTEHHDDLRARFEAEAPRWLPDAVYGRAFDQLHKRVRERLAAMAADPDHEARQQFADWLAGLPERLQTSPELRERGENLKRDILASPVLRDWSSWMWKNTKETLRVQSADPDSELRRRMAAALTAAGRRLESDPGLQERFDRVTESGARALASQFHDELADLVTGTIRRWDAHQTSFQLELLLGRDLQFIRINGTVVGAGVGLALHAIALARG